MIEIKAATGCSTFNSLMKEQDILTCLRGVIDPEIGANIVDLGLVQEIRFHNRGFNVRMSTTSPSCPMSGYLGDTARALLNGQFPNLDVIEVEVVWDPNWSPERLSPELKAQFGWT